MVLAISLLPGCSGSSSSPGTAPTKTRNPLRLVDQFDRPVENPLNVSDVTVTTKDTTRRSSATYAHLWLALDDREREKWINTPGFGEGNKFDNYVETLLESGRILPIPAGTRVRVLELKPAADRTYVSTYFKVEVLDGPYQGRSGWVSYFGLKHN